MKYINIGLLLITCFGIKAQGGNDFKPLKDKIINLGKVIEDNEQFGEEYKNLDLLLKDVDIVMLGEQSHGEATTYQTKIKLIKYLHQKLDFDILVFESGFYECHKALDLIAQGKDRRDAMGESVTFVWSTMKEFKPLVEYIESSSNSGNQLKVLGFDNQFTGKLSKEYFISDLSQYLNKIDVSIVQTKEWQHFTENCSHLTNYETKQLKRNHPELDTIYINHLINEINNASIDPLSGFWVQSLKSLKYFLSDISLKTDKRDQQMADNLIWIKENFPKSKIICWGATSHFLYNSMEVRMRNPIVQLLGGSYYKKQPMMGNYIKTKYDSKVFTIGFTAYKGKYGLTRGRKLRRPRKGTLEWLLSKSEHNNFLLPLKNINIKGYKSRPLGNFYMKNDAGQVMDAIIFNRTMKPPKLDHNFFLKMYPENKYVKPEVTEQ